MRNRPRRVPSQLQANAREMRKEPAPAEVIMWNRLRNRQLGGFKFRRQNPNIRFVIDFYCAECKLIVELDGDSHSDRVVYDENRTKELAAAGLKVIRFLNTDVFENLDSVLEAILRECQACSASSPHPNPLP